MINYIHDESHLVFGHFRIIVPLLLHAELHQRTPLTWLAEQAGPSRLDDSRNQCETYVEREIQGGFRGLPGPIGMNCFTRSDCCELFAYEFWAKILKMNGMI